MHQENFQTSFTCQSKWEKIQLDDPELLLMNQDSIEDFGGNCLGLHPSKIMGMMESRELW